jgi:hypothetical protein
MFRQKAATKFHGQRVIVQAAPVRSAELPVHVGAGLTGYQIGDVGQAD